MTTAAEFAEAAAASAESASGRADAANVAANRAEAAEQSAAGHASAAKDDAEAAASALKTVLETAAKGVTSDDLQRALDESLEDRLPTIFEHSGEGYEVNSNDLLGQLTAMDAKARDQGHSLLSILNKCASSYFGIDITPDAPSADTDEDADA